MQFEAKSSVNYEPLSEGVHIAVCDMIADMGLQEGWQGKTQHKVYIRWAVPDERIEYEDKDGNQQEGPRIIGATYTASMNEKANLRKMIESWFAKSFPSDEAASSFDIAQLAGRACQINVTHTTKGDRTYANIAAVMPLPKGAEAPKLDSDPIIYPDKNVLSDLPSWMQEKISNQAKPVSEDESLEQAAELAAMDDSDVPF